MRCQNNCAPLFHNTSYDIPQETPSFWIHTGGRFILKLRQGLLEKRNQLTKKRLFPRRKFSRTAFYDISGSHRKGFQVA